MVGRHFTIEDCSWAGSSDLLPRLAVLAGMSKTLPITSFVAWRTFLLCVRQLLETSPSMEQVLHVEAQRVIVEQVRVAVVQMLHL